MQKITPFLWFDGKAEEAMNFYMGIFKNSKAGKATRWGDGGPEPKGKVMKDPRLAKMMDPKTLPFDAKRMFWGGFKGLIET